MELKVLCLPLYNIHVSVDKGFGFWCVFKAQKNFYQYVFGTVSQLELNISLSLVGSEGTMPQYKVYMYNVLTLWRCDNEMVVH